MKIGVPKEIKAYEFRVAATPNTVRALVSAGHQVVVETGAGAGSSYSDEEYRQAGADIVPSAADAWAQELVLKVKEPAASEYGYLREDQILFAYLHLAADRTLTETLLEKGTTGIAYETVELPNGSLPLLTPMSEVAGRMSVQVGAHHLTRFMGGRGLLLGGVPGVNSGEVVILGGGMVGTNAAKMALGLGARVTILDVNHARLQYLDDVFGNRIQTLVSNFGNIEDAVQRADLLIGSVLIQIGRASCRESGKVVVGEEGRKLQGGRVRGWEGTTHDSSTQDG